MFINVIDNSFWRTIKNSGYLTATELDVFGALIDYADIKNHSCFPNLKTLAGDCQRTVRTIQNSINSLVNKGVLAKEPRFDPIYKGQTSNLYTLNLDKRFWYDKAKAYLEQKNKGHRRPSTALYSQPTRTKAITNALAMSNDKPYTENRQEQKSAINETKPRRKTIKTAEIISMEQLRKDFRHDELLAAAPTRADIIDPLFEALYKVFNNRKDKTPVNKYTSKPTQWLISNIKALTIDSFKEIISNIAAGAEEIKNLGAYIMTCIVDHINKLAINLRHEVNADLRAGAGTKAAAEATEPQQIISIDANGRICLKAAPGRAAGEKTAQTPARSEAPAPSETIYKQAAAPAETDYDDILRQKYACFRTTAAAFTA
jgi:hypothetical protein